MKQIEPQKEKSCSACVVSFAALFGLGLLLSLVIPPLMPTINRLRTEQKARFEQPFLDQMNEYTGVLGAASGSVPHGKMMVIELGTRMVDDMYYELPRRHQAQSPAEVGVLIWMDCVNQTFTYLGVKTAFIDWETCSVTVIDWTSRTIVASQKFTGNEPPAEISVSDDDSILSSEELERSYGTTISREKVIEWILTQVK